MTAAAHVTVSRWAEAPEYRECDYCRGAFAPDEPAIVLGTDRALGGRFFLHCRCLALLTEDMKREEAQP